MQIPARPGTYALLLAAVEPHEIVVGRLGRLRVEPGVYVYVGSALGPGGLAARLGHHLNPERATHWHIDYLRQFTRLDEVWYTCDAVRREHQWADLAGSMSGAVIPLSRFGASDCNCPAHLFHFATAPTFEEFQRRVRERIMQAQPLQAVRNGPGWSFGNLSFRSEPQPGTRRHKRSAAQAGRRARQW